jgi:hypothetical protein
MKDGDWPRYRHRKLRVRCIDSSDVQDYLIKGAEYDATESDGASETYIVGTRSFLKSRFEPVTENAGTRSSHLPDEDVEDFPTSGPDEITDPKITIEKKEGES